MSSTYFLAVRQMLREHRVHALQRCFILFRLLYILGHSMSVVLSFVTTCRCCVEDWLFGPKQSSAASFEDSRRCAISPTLRLRARIA